MTAEADDNSLVGHLWSDDPARVDFLAARAIAATVTDVVLDNALDPLSLGLSGPWGSGKTTVLELVEADLAQRSTSESKVVVVRTDPWRYDPAVGAKESIIADVLEALEAELERVTPKVKTEAKSALRRLAKRVDWSKAIQLAAKSGLALQLPRFEDLTDLIKEPADSDDEDGAPRGLLDSVKSSGNSWHVRNWRMCGGSRPWSMTSTGACRAPSSRASKQSACS